MAEKDEFFLPEDIDRQIEAVKQSKEGDQSDAETLVYLSSYYQADALPQQETLDRIWNRIADAPLLQQNIQENRKKLLKSFADRSADTAKLPENFLKDTKAEIYFYGDKVAIINWYEEFGVIIQNKDVFELLKEMFNSTKYMLKKYDQNEKIARRLIDVESE